MFLSPVRFKWGSECVAIQPSCGRICARILQTIFCCLLFGPILLRGNYSERLALNLSRRLSGYFPNVVSPFVKSVRVRIFGPCPRVGITCHRHLSGSLKCGLSFNKLSLLLWFQVIVNTLVAQINCCYSFRNA